MYVRDAVVLRGFVRLAGMSERQLALRAGIAPATVGHLLSGRRSSCSAATATAIEGVLACPPGTFFSPVAEQRPEKVGHSADLGAGGRRR